MSIMKRIYSCRYFVYILFIITNKTLEISRVYFFYMWAYQRVSHLLDGKQEQDLRVVASYWRHGVAWWPTLRLSIEKLLHHWVPGLALINNKWRYYCCHFYLIFCTTVVPPWPSWPFRLGTVWLFYLVQILFYRIIDQSNRIKFNVEQTVLENNSMGTKT